MTRPIAFCDECGRTRDPFDHMRADLPSAAAMDAIYRSCPVATAAERKRKRGSKNARKCPIQYRAGVVLPVRPAALDLAEREGNDGR